MSTTWNTKYGPRRVRHDPPTLEEAIFAARGLTDDVEQQIDIAAGLMEVSADEVRAALKKSPPPRKPAATVAFTSRGGTERGRGGTQDAAPRVAGPRRDGPLAGLTLPNCRTRFGRGGGILRPWETRWGPAMPIVENSADRLALRSGSTTLVLDKKANTAAFSARCCSGISSRWRRLFRRHRGETRCGSRSRLGVEVCHTMLVMRGGAAWALAASDKKDAEASTAQVRGFLGLA